MSARRLVHFVGDGLARAPDFFSGHRVQAKQNFVFALAGENVNLSIRFDGRGVTEPDVIFHSSFNPFGQVAGTVALLHRAIAIRAAPLRPVCLQEVADDNTRRR
jgi:hypothetical protein